MEDMRCHFFLFYSGKTSMMYIEAQSLKKGFFKNCLNMLQTFLNKLKKIIGSLGLSEPMLSRQRA